MTKEKSNWRTLLGITPGNPFARYTIILTVLLITVLAILVFFIFAGSTAKARYHAGVAFMITGAFAAIPLALLVIYARNYVRIQSILEGNYWAHWKYKKEEVYISPLGIYYPNRRFTLKTFSHQLQKVEIPEDSPYFIHFDYLYLHDTSPTRAATRHEKKIAVPIPEGKEEEARNLVRRFQQEQVGKPSISTLDQIRIVWIMGFGILAFVVLCVIFVLRPLNADYAAEIKAKRVSEDTALREKQVAQLLPVLSQVRQVIDFRIEHLKMLAGGEMSAGEAGFDESFGIDKVIYGYCTKDKSFYIIVILKKDLIKRTYLGGTGAFYYTARSGQNYSNCGPEYLHLGLPVQLGDGWYYGNLSNVNLSTSPIKVTMSIPSTIKLLNRIYISSPKSKLAT